MWSDAPPLWVPQATAIIRPADERLRKAVDFLVAPPLIRSVVGAGGANDAFTKVMLHLDGADGSTTFTDNNVGGSAHTWSRPGGATTQIDTAISKFGGAALLHNAAAGDSIFTAGHADFNLGSGAFTIDCWFNRAGGNGVERYMIGRSPNGASVANIGFAMLLGTTNVVRGLVSNGSALTYVTGTTAFTAAGWHHAAFVRTGNILKLFVDGVQEGGDVAFAVAVNSFNGTLAVGQLGAQVAATFWNGSLDEVRLSVGVARWTANFTPPTAAYSP